MSLARESSNLSIPTISRAIGAVGARLVHTEEVTGSNPVLPTIFSRDGGLLTRACGRSSVVERLLPKQKVASSNLVARSICRFPGLQAALFVAAEHMELGPSGGWAERRIRLSAGRRSQVAKAEVCKTSITGSTPVAASISPFQPPDEGLVYYCVRLTLCPIPLSMKPMWS